MQFFFKQRFLTFSDNIYTIRFGGSRFTRSMIVKCKVECTLHEIHHEIVLKRPEALCLRSSVLSPVRQRVRQRVHTKNANTNR